ncbi:alkaline phosphatase [Sulfitobacter undariae]|uniref:Alkaline phosphatase n=1 Tax=Sulfitobacter undariae TaxID=1563671 RepID=A0A7W6H240_9RHOB|nr:alkaline phosphatase [Sulfitobacter undariae]MBB3995433.1 alkaline phosphatase [Sulfitobacter undariae]
MNKLLTLSLLASLTATTAIAQDIPQSDNQWFIDGQAQIAARLATQQNTNRAKNIIVLIADGNGVGTNYATRLYQGQKKGNYGDEEILPQEAFPNLALVKTYNTNGQTPDSAGTGTAIMSGVKTKAGVIGVNENVNRGDCATVPGNEVATMNEIMAAMGKATGVVSTARITHATPATSYASSADRNWEESVPEGCTTQVDIAQQLVEAIKNGTVDVAMGGGRRNFIGTDVTDEEGKTGRRADGVNLIEALKAEGVQYAWGDESFGALNLDGSKPILGLFESSHMQYEADREGEPSLAEMSSAAIKSLQAAGGDNGFFLQIEAGRVDHANHDGNLARAVEDGVAFAETVAMVDALTDDEDTLIIVTADHEHAIAFNGYCGRGSNILGLCMDIDNAGEKNTGTPLLAEDGKPFTVAGYLNGGGSVMREELNWAGVRGDLTEEQATDGDYMQQALIPTGAGEETHSGEDVAVYAKGPYAHLFDGTIEQNVIFHAMNYAANAQ